MAHIYILTYLVALLNVGPCLQRRDIHAIVISSAARQYASDPDGNVA
jgi:hypothetical protein